MAVTVLQGKETLTRNNTMYSSNEHAVGELNKQKCIFECTCCYTR